MDHRPARTQKRRKAEADILKLRRISRMSSQIDRILAETRRSLERRKAAVPATALEAAAAAHAPRGFARGLRLRAASAPAVIAELKKASPSRGLIRQRFDVAELASGLAAGGAAALSVLTEEAFFQGSLKNLETASRVSGLPCLRKDFLLDEYQVLEARAHGADAVLLIAAALDDARLRQLVREAHACELDVLCEVHTGEELERVLGLGCDAVGVNNRNLKTFEVRLEVSLDLAERLPEGAVRVAESGIETAEDIERLRRAGFHAFLVGESLMRQPDPGRALFSLLRPAAGEKPAPAVGMAGTGR